MTYWSNDNKLIGKFKDKPQFKTMDVIVSLEKYNYMKVTLCHDMCFHVPLIEGEGGGKDQLVSFEYIGIEYLMGSQVGEMSNKYHPLTTRNFYAIPPPAGDIGTWYQNFVH